jgi:hypothetical protein
LKAYEEAFKPKVKPMDLKQSNEPSKTGIFGKKGLSPKQ